MGSNTAQIVEWFQGQSAPQAVGHRGIRLEENAEAFLFLYAVQQPLVVFFLRLSYRPQVLPYTEAMTEQELLAAWGNWHKHAFAFQPCDSVRHDKLPYVAGDAVMFIRHAMISGDNVVGNWLANSFLLRS